VVDDFILSRRRPYVGQDAGFMSYPINPSGPICCGGNAVPDPSSVNLRDTGEFSREAAIGSIQVKLINFIMYIRGIITLTRSLKSA